MRIDNIDLGEVLEKSDKQKLYARLVKGKNPDDFKMLSSDLGREVVMVMGSDGIDTLTKLSDYEKLLYIGHKEEYLDSKLKAGFVYKLFVFSLSEQPPLATWENVLSYSHKLYPATRHFTSHFLPALKELKIQEVEKSLGYSLMEVEHAGVQDERFITYERFKKSVLSINLFRAFLYFSFHLKELYSGDGFTYTEKGKAIMREYLFPNQPVIGLSHLSIFDLNPRK